MNGGQAVTRRHARESRAPLIKVGDIVRFRSDDGTYHVRLLELGRVWARVQFFGPGVRHEDGTRSPRVKRVRTSDLEVSLW